MKTLKKIVLFILLLTIVVNSLPAQQKTIITQKQQITYISGRINDSLRQDTLSLILHGPFFYNGVPERGAVRVLTTVPDKQGEFKFEILSANSPFHISLFLSGKRNSNNGLLMGVGDIADYLVEPGDSIHIVFDKHTRYHSGKGAELFDAQYDSNKIAETDGYGNAIPDPHNYLQHDIERWLKQKDTILNTQLNALAAYQTKISPIAYRIVRADLIGANRSWVYTGISSTRPFVASGLALDQDLEKVYQQLKQRPAYIDQADRAALSPKYIDYLYKKLVIEVKYQQLVNHVRVWDGNYFPVIQKEYTGMLRDKLLVFWLTQMASANNLRPEYLTNALAVIQNPVFKQMAEELKATYAKGQPIKDFDFKDANGKTVHLSELKGKVLLIDLWFSGCAGCVMVAAGLPHVEEAFKNRPDVAFVSISIDKNKTLWLNSIAKKPAGQHYSHYTTPTTIYLYTGGTGALNPFIKAYVPEGSYPSLLIIDKKSKIFSSTPSRPVDTAGQKSLIKEINEALLAK